MVLETVMGWRSVLRPRAVAVCCLAACVGYAAAPALAQAANLTAAHVVLVGNGGARLALTFSSGLPKYEVYGNGTTQVTVMLMNRSPVSNAPTAIPAVGPIAAGQISVVGATTTIVLYLRAPTTLQVAPGAGSTLLVDIPSAAPAAPSAAAQPVPNPLSLVTGQGTVSKVVALRYADVSEVVGILSGSTVAPSSNFQAQQSAFGSPSGLGAPSGLGSAGGSASGFGTSTSPTVNFASVTGSAAQQESAGQRVNDNIAIDRRLNAIILTGTPDQIAAFEALIDTVDVPLRSVMFQTEIVELTDSAATNLGIDFTNGAGTGQIGAATLTITKANETGTTTTPNQLSLQAAIYAQVQKGNGRIIATPRILALDGKQASILTGDALPIITSIAVSGVNAVQQQVQYVNVGVDLQIEARSSADGYVTAQVFFTVSSVEGYTDSYPQIAQRQASTTVTVKDGQPFVIGGLLQKTENYNRSKIPVLGDIPLIGGLFRLRQDTASTDNLYIVVIPQIIEAGGMSPLPSRGP